MTDKQQALEALRDEIHQVGDDALEALQEATDALRGSEETLRMSQPLGVDLIGPVFQVLAQCRISDVAAVVALTPLLKATLPPEGWGLDSRLSDTWAGYRRCAALVARSRQQLAKQVGTWSEDCARDVVASAKRSLASVSAALYGALTIFWLARQQFLQQVVDLGLPWEEWGVTAQGLARVGVETE